MTAGLTCVKLLHSICNLIFTIAGLLILAVGLTVQLNYSHYSNFVNDHIWTAPIIMIIVGAVVTFTSCLGCCGTLKENGCMILLFTILTVILFLFEIGLGIAGYIEHTKLSHIMEVQFNNTMNSYNEREEYRDAWSILQTEMECCGTYGPNDWENIVQNHTLPSSCCTIINLNEADACTVADAHTEGCLNKLLKLLDSKTILLAGVALGVFGIQISTIVCACCLFRSFRK